MRAADKSQFLVDLAMHKKYSEKKTPTTAQILTGCMISHFYTYSQHFNGGGG